ncbi:MAG: type II toxin-antitoxin system VapC family toxin, partial [Thaumarchaeota archaeon]|nr:type II toxin-antitoxin system VapC family toxin [Nitrososphaerota archaeon]
VIQEIQKGVSLSLIFDTSALIQSIRRQNGFEEGSISVITLIEILRGIEDQQKRGKTIALIKDAFDILDVNEEVVQSYVKLYFELKKKGELASDADELIAATAHSKGETLVTTDKDFLKFEPFIKVKLLAAK